MRFTDYSKGQLDAMDGIDLIEIERSEQKDLHGYDIDNDIDHNGENQLAIGAIGLIMMDEVDGDAERRAICPPGWNENVWIGMTNKSYLKRLVIAGALIAAEIDRIRNTDE